MSSDPKNRLGERLVDRGLITPEQLDIALHKQKETGELLGITLLELGFIDEEAVFMPVLAGQYGVDFVNVKDKEISSDVICRIPAKFATHYKVLPVDFQNDTLVLATIHPLDVNALDEIKLVVPSKIDTVLASQKDILEGIRKYYGVGAETIDQMMGAAQVPQQEVEQVTVIDESDSDASISKFLNQILLEAYRDRATDIHIEPFDDELQIRYRVDGVLVDAKVPTNLIHFKDALNSRIKILSNLNIAEKRLPQDGRFKVRVGGVDLDLRVSFMPTPYGEGVVMRVLNTSDLFTFDDLGLTQKERDTLKSLVEKPHGIIFITGPTGSGKTTTLYSCLSRINTEEKKIITIEDPVEYQLKGVTQVQVNPAIGLNFAAGLRSMLRHDPDVMMIGEVRDIETAEIAVQVALTGHLVFSTLHTNDAASGVTRLLDMGVDSYLMTSTVECFVAQRLVRSLCPKCKQQIPISEQIIKDAEGYLDTETKIIFKANGCESCNQTGYKGRSAIYEFLVFNDHIRKLIMERASANAIKGKAIENGMRTLAKAGWQKVKDGLTTPEEILRVTKEEV